MRIRLHILSMVLITAFGAVKPGCSQARQGNQAHQAKQQEIDSLILLFKDAGRNWNLYAEQFVAIGEPAVPALVTLLKDTSQTQWTRRIAAMTLNDIHSPSYIEPALELLLDRNEQRELRNHVTRGLTGHDLSRVAGELWDLFREEKDEYFRLNIAGILKSSDPDLAYLAYGEIYHNYKGYCQQQALRNLVLLRPQESARWYISAIQEEDWMTGNLAMDSLISTGHFTPGRITRILNRDETTELIRWRIIRVLGHRPEMDYLYQLLEALDDPGWLVYNEAALALTRMPPEMVLPELRYLEQGGDSVLVSRAGWVRHKLDFEPNREFASMQPFDGYPMLEDVEEIRKVLRKKCVDTIGFRPGDVVADVGAGNGYLEAMLSMFHDDITFYIQDIDPEVCNPGNTRAVVDFYQEVHGRPFSNSFFTVIGTDWDTNLPDRTFDKILMLWTYQYLKNPREFILDLRENLKEGGLFYVINPDQDYEYGKLLNIEYGWNGSTVEKQISDIIGCGFELIRITRNYDDVEMPYSMVFKKK